MRVKYVLTALCLTLLCFGAVGSSSAAEPQTHTNSIGMEFVLIPAGSFMMGTDSEGFIPAEPELGVRKADSEGLIPGAKPVHKVTISKPFYLGKYEVTQAEWEAVMGSNPSQFQGRDNPVEQVSWRDVQEFIQRLNQKEGHNRYRLPTEAEWEYAARAGTNSAYSFGDDKSELSRYAWYDEDFYTGFTHPVGKKQPNPWGLYDVHGNVWEFVQDRYDAEYYASSPATDPKGPVDGFICVIRGGGWYGDATNCLSAFRGNTSLAFRIGYQGFRLALSPE